MERFSHETSSISPSSPSIAEEDLMQDLVAIRSGKTLKPTWIQTAPLPKCPVCTKEAERTTSILSFAAKRLIS
jgi:hypothetical protein